MAKAKAKNDQTRLRIMFGILAVLAVLALWRNFGGGGGDGGGNDSSSVPTTTVATFTPLTSDDAGDGTTDGTSDGTTDTTVAATSDDFVEATRNPFDPDGGAAVLDESDE